MRHTSKTIWILVIVFLILVLWGFTHLLKSSTQMKEQSIKLENDLKKLKDENMKMLNNQSPEIIEISFSDTLGNDLLNDGWVTVGDDDRAKITIRVRGNCTSVDMFIKPTGTETYLLQKIIDSITGNPGQNEFEYIWDVPKGTMGHFWVIAYNNKNGRLSEAFNIYNE